MHALMVCNLSVRAGSRSECPINACISRTPTHLDMELSGLMPGQQIQSPCWDLQAVPEATNQVGTCEASEQEVKGSVTTSCAAI